MKLVGCRDVVEFQGQYGSCFERLQRDVTRLGQTNIRSSIDHRIPERETRAKFRDDQTNATRSNEEEILFLSFSLSFVLNGERRSTDLFGFIPVLNSQMGTPV